MAGLVAVMIIFFGWALIAGRLTRWGVTAPLAMVLLGMALTAGSDPLFVINLETSAAESGVEVILAILLFLDATEVPAKAFRRQRGVIIRLLAIALPLSLGLAWLAGLVLFPDQNYWVLALLATITVPIDLAPAGPVLRDKRIPARVRESLNVESGFNDGLVAPVFLICLAGATAGAAGEPPLEALVEALPAVLVAVLVGLAIGAAGAWSMIKVFTAGWTEPSALRVGVLALPLLSYGVAILFAGNGFVAAFVAGICFGAATRRLPADALHLTEDIGTMLTLVVWFIFGQVVNDTIGDGGLWGAVPYAAVGLTVVRMVPVFIALIGSGVDLPDRFVIGWLGPRGLASIVFGLLAFIALNSPENDSVATVMVATVALSVVCHGLTVRMIGAWYDRRSDGLARKMLS
jgi:NhaP-type Na+/H+ or K+/H+ antiporter